MNDQASAKLCEIVSQYGPGICDEPRKLRALLADVCPSMPRQVNTLVAAAEQQVVAELRGSAATVPWSILAGRLVRRLVEETGMAEPDAQWVVTVWGKALGRADAVASAPPGPVQDQSPVLRDRPQGGFRQGLMVGALLIGLVALGGWLVFRQRDPDPVKTEPVLAQQKVRPALLDCTGENGVSAAEIRKVQKAWAEYLGREVEETVEIDKGVKMTFVLVPPGKFRMGSPEGEKDRFSNELLHLVTLTEPYYLGKFEVTQAQYEALTDKNPSEFKGADLPVENVSWKEAQAFAEQLTKLRYAKQVCRLPTEAEWEYACRAGSTGRYSFGDKVDDLGAHAWYEASSKGEDPLVGKKKPNAWGLYDMHGNVWEWCFDRYGEYPAGEATNPSGPSEGPRRVYRGGCRFSNGSYCRSAIRRGYVPGSVLTQLGFRLARSVPSGGE